MCSRVCHGVVLEPRRASRCRARWRETRILSAACGSWQLSTIDEWLTIEHRAPSLASLSADHQCHDDCGADVHARAADLARRRSSVGVRSDRRGPHGRGRLRDRRGAGTDAADDPDGHRAGADAVPRRAGSAPHRVARASDGGVLAQLEPHRRVRDLRPRDRAARPQGEGARRARRGAPRRRSARDRVPVVGYLFIDEPEANARKAKAFVDAGYTELQAQGRPRLRRRTTTRSRRSATRSGRTSSCGSTRT